MSALNRQQTINQAFDIDGARVRCQIAEANALTEFLNAADKAAHWRGMFVSGKRLVIAQRLAGMNIEATEEAISYWVARYEDRYSNEMGVK